MQSPKPSSMLFTRPRFCPNPGCRHHQGNQLENTRWFTKKGTFPTQIRGEVQRFQCKACKKYCSAQTFHISYYSHSNINYEVVDKLQRNCVGTRQACRILNLTIQVYLNTIQRIARGKLALFDFALTDYQINEPAAMDGFESFVVSQYSPTNVHLLVGSNSQFPYYIDLVVMNRKGRMTEKQKEHRDTLQKHWKAPANGILLSCKQMFKDIVPWVNHYVQVAPWVLFSDEKPQYVTAMKQVMQFRKKLEDRSIIHSRIHSKYVRNLQNFLFPVNYLDREIRTNLAGHVRETIRYDREVNMAMCRLVILLGYHGFFKMYRIEEKKLKDKNRTHAEVARLLEIPGIQERKGEIFTHRRVFTLSTSKMKWIQKAWRCEYENPKQVNFATGECKDKGQAGNRVNAKHLVA